MEKKQLRRNTYKNDLSINSKEIELSLNSKDAINPNSSKIILKERNNNNNSMKYYPISTNIYLAIEDHENIKKKNINLYQKYMNENNIKKKNIESKKIKNSIRLQINETNNKENINININKNENKINTEEKVNQINSNYQRIFNVNRHNLNKKGSINIKNNKKFEEKKVIPHSYSFDNYLELNNMAINETKIFDESFVEGIKNINRKNNLIKAIEKYKKFKSLRLRIPLNNCLINGFCSDDGRKKSYQKINTYDKIIEEENESESEMTKRKEKIKTINKNNIKSSIHLNSIKKIKNGIKKNNALFLFDYINKKKKLNKNLNQKISNKKSNTILVRRILREERYIIDENGKEKILEVNQSLFPKKIYTKKIKNNNSKNENDEEAEKIINKEKYKINSRKIDIPSNKINQNNYENSFISHRKRKSLYVSSPSKIKGVNGHIIDLLKQKQKPITIKKNKLEKKINFSNVNINININKSKCLNTTNSSVFNDKLYTIQNQTCYSKERKDNDEINLSNEKKKKIYTIKRIYNNENKIPIKSFRQNFSFNGKTYTEGNNIMKRLSINEIIKNKNMKNIKNKNMLSLRYHKSMENTLKIKTSNIASSSIENISQNNCYNYCDISSQTEYNKKLLNKINPFIENIYSRKK